MLVLKPALSCVSAGYCDFLVKVLSCKSLRHMAKAKQIELNVLN